MTFDKIKHFNDGLKEHGRTNKKDLLTSIKYARKINSGEMTFQQVKKTINSLRNDDSSNKDEADNDKSFIDLINSPKEESKNNNDNNDIDLSEIQQNSPKVKKRLRKKGEETNSRVDFVSLLSLNPSNIPIAEDPDNSKSDMNDSLSSSSNNDNKDEEENNDDDEDVSEDQYEHKSKQLKLKLSTIIESLVFVKVNSSGNSSLKGLMLKLKEIEEITDYLKDETGIYQVRTLIFNN